MTDKKIKIIFAITKASWGGAQQYVYDLATALSKDKYEVLALAGSDGPLIEKLKAYGIRTITITSLSRDIRIWDDFRSFFKIYKVFRQEKPEIIHLNSSKMGFIGALAGRITRVPKIIFTGHGWAFNEDRSLWQKKIIRLIHLLTVAMSHKTIAVSEQTKNQILKKGKYDSKVVVIRNGIEAIDFINKNSAREKICERLPPDFDLDNRPWLGTISELHKNKGLKYLIEAVHLSAIANDDRTKLPILIIIGEGERRTKLQQRITRYRLEDTIFLVGRMEEAKRYLKAFDVFTLTSITEALPYALLEAGQAGLPIIASAVGGIPEILDDMKSGILVRPKEPREIQKAIDFLLQNPERMTALGQNIQKKISTDFTKETMVKKTIELYN